MLFWLRCLFYPQDEGDTLAKVNKYLAAFCTLLVASCSSAYIIITLSGETRTQALWITGILLVATVIITAIELKEDD